MASTFVLTATSTAVATLVGFSLASIAGEDDVFRFLSNEQAATTCFAVACPMIYQVGGSVLYSGEGWSFFQPGVGGARFVALQTIAWTIYAITLVMMYVAIKSDDPQMEEDFATGGAALGMMSYFFLFTSLLAYRGPGHKAKENNTDYERVASVFNLDLQNSDWMINNSGAGPATSSFWYLFVGLQMIVAFTGLSITYGVEKRVADTTYRHGAIVIALSMFLAVTSVTHTLGGRWKHLHTNYSGFQPFIGGPVFVTLQMAAWSMLASALMSGLGPLACDVAGFAKVDLNSQSQETCDYLDAIAPSTIGMLGFMSEVLIVASLFTFQGETIAPGAGNVTGASPVFNPLIRLQFALLDFLFGQVNPLKKTRPIRSKKGDGLTLPEQRWKKITKDCPTTGKQYLLIGATGFVGKRLVKRLLDRGETKLRIFDIAPNNPFAGNPNVEMCRGDVTNQDDIDKAMVGVETCYCLFAIIRFQDRLEHQAPLSYRINVLGTRAVLNACKKHNVQKLIVTSSSHATTDEHSQPRFNRDESAPYVIRSTAHNHYGWTKAIADQEALAANGFKLPNGKKMEVCIVRPCSGVFGADDRLSFEKGLDLGVIPILGKDEVFDWVYCDNVVLGHLMAEKGMELFPEKVAGEAFNISNNEPVSVEDFWFLIKKHHMRMGPAAKTPFDAIYIPMLPLWIIGYISEFNQYLFRGKVSLGADIDMLSPAALSTAILTYTYHSNKAREVLGYEPAFTLDEAIEKSLDDYYKLPTKWFNQTAK